MNWQGSVFLHERLYDIGPGSAKGTPPPPASETQHNEKALDWNASPIIAESEFPARKIFSRRIRVVERRKTVMKKEGKKGVCGSQTGFPPLGAADLRTLAKARQNRMWKIEFI